MASLVFIAAACSACSMTSRLYEGEPRPPSEVAVLVPGYHHSVGINRINGKITWWQRVEVPAGEHTIEGTCMPDPDDDYCPTGEVIAYLEVGKTYRLEADTVGMYGDCEFYVEEVDLSRTTMGSYLTEILSNRE